MLHSICLSLVYLTPGSLYLLILTLIYPFPLPLPFGDHESAFCIFEYVSVLHRDSFAYFKGTGQRLLGREARRASQVEAASCAEGRDRNAHGRCREWQLGELKGRKL